MAAEGTYSHNIARDLGISRLTAQLWRQRFLSHQCAGLEKDAPRPGRIPRITPQQIKAVVEATLHTTPANATHWSTRTMARARGLSQPTIRRIWKQHNLKPALDRNVQAQPRQTFCRKAVRRCWALSESARQVSGTVCGRKESNPSSRQDSAGTAIEEGPVRNDDARLQTQWHNYAVCVPEYARRQSDWGLHAATSASRIHPFFQEDRQRNPVRAQSSPDCGQLRHTQTSACTILAPTTSPFYLHFIPTSSSWLNLVERWFREITDKRIRRGAFDSVQALIAAIEEYSANHNQNPRVFIWSAPMDKILSKIAKCKEALDSLH